MMRSILILMLAVSSAIFTVSAQEVDKVRLKDGRCFNGYISKQIPGESVFVTTSDGIVLIPWEDIDRTEKILQENPCSGIREVVALSYGDTLTGRIVDQELGRNILFQLDRGSYMEVNLSDILSIKSEPISDTISIWRQFPLLDRLVLKSGEVVDGVILSREMGKSVTMLFRDSSESKTYALSEIAVYQKIRKGGGGKEGSLIQNVSLQRDSSDIVRLTLDIINPPDGVFLIKEEGSDIMLELQEAK